MGMDTASRGVRSVHSNNEHVHVTIRILGVNYTISLSGAARGQCTTPMMQSTVRR